MLGALPYGSSANCRSKWASADLKIYLDASLAERAHPYTQGLFAARPALGAPRGVKLATIQGSVPELVDLPSGCPFAGRCSFTIDACHTTRPPAKLLPRGHEVRCIRLDEIATEEAKA